MPRNVLHRKGLLKAPVGLSMLDPVPLQEDLMELLRVQLRSRKLSAARVARNLGWKPSKISRALQSKTRIKVDDLEQLLAALQVRPVDVVRALAGTLGQSDSRGGVIAEQTTDYATKDKREKLIDLLLDRLDELEKTPKNGG